MRALTSNTTLKELKLANQVSGVCVCVCVCVYVSCVNSCSFCSLTHTYPTQYTRGGQRLELEIAKHLEKNHSILKLGFSFTANGPRVQVEKYTMRNQDACE